jgi:hypothetical protein
VNGAGSLADAVRSRAHCVEDASNDDGYLQHDVVKCANGVVLRANGVFHRAGVVLFLEDAVRTLDHVVVSTESAVRSLAHDVGEREHDVCSSSNGDFSRSKEDFSLEHGVFFPSLDDCYLEHVVGKERHSAGKLSKGVVEIANDVFSLSHVVSQGKHAVFTSVPDVRESLNGASSYEKEDFCLSDAGFSLDHTGFNENHAVFDVSYAERRLLHDVRSLRHAGCNVDDVVGEPNHDVFRFFHDVMSISMSSPDPANESVTTAARGRRAASDALAGSSRRSVGSSSTSRPFFMRASDVLKREAEGVEIEARAPA